MSDNIQVIYRFKFTNDFQDKLNSFALIHKFDSRQDYKEAWESWMNENKEIINEEEEKLKRLGYNGDLESKMFRSVKYYFSKKSNDKCQAKKRRVYINITKQILIEIDNHIKIKVLRENIKPSDGYTLFIEEFKDLINVEYERLKTNGLNKEDIEMKLKKTYKNRYFIFNKNKNH